MSFLKIVNGTVYDPANGVDGKLVDLWVHRGKIVAPPLSTEDVSTRTIDASGLVIMPGGIDMHAHIAGPKVNYARKMRPEDRRNAAALKRTSITRSGTLGSTPSTFATGYLYAGMGYTTVFDAAIPPLGARHTHEEFHDTPIIDKGFFVLLGNNHFALRQVASNNLERLRSFAGWLLNATKGYGLKIVNPGGVERWKSGTTGHTTGLDTRVGHFDVTPRQIIVAIAQTAMDLGLPHPVHVHCNQLGIPGNWLTTLETMKALEGRKAHLTHIQFHSYGGGADDQGTFCSHARQLADYVNDHSNITIDVGQVMFGQTTSMTGDGPLGYYLHKVTGKKWFNADTEMEAGCGIVPITYRNRSLVHALQWAIGLEWYLLIKDPWQIAMSTDHPNGAAFLAYPEIIQLLMDRSYRELMLKRLPDDVRKRCLLPDLTREYTLNEIAIITRAAPARMLGLSHKGHLGVGADADIAFYMPGKDIKTMFETPRMVLKAGEVIIEQGELRSAPFGPALHVQPGYDGSTLGDLKDWFEQYYTISFGNYPVDESYLSRGSRIVPCSAGSS